MNDLASRGGRPTFDDVFARLQAGGSADVISSKGTKYLVRAEVREGRKVIEAYPSGSTSRVSIHDDCWGDDATCQGSRAGGVYNGSPSIYDWFDTTG